MMKNPAESHHGDPFLLSLLVCPLTGSALILSDDRTELISKPAKRAYPIRDGIPIMVESETRLLTDEDLKSI